MRDPEIEALRRDYRWAMETGDLESALQIAFALEAKRESIETSELTERECVGSI